MSSPSDTDLEGGITEKIALTKKKSKKKKRKPAPVVPIDHTKNEGDDPHWAYEPPEGALLLDHTVDAGEFEWGTIKHDKDTEIWLIRVPDSIKPKHLKGLEIDPPSSSQTARIGGFTKKKTSYDVWCIGNDDSEVIGAEELRGLSCLLPRKKKDGKLFIAPKPVSHHIVISATSTTATTVDHQPSVYKNPPRASYPKDVLKHAFVPYGARSRQSLPEDPSMDVDTIPDKLPDTVLSPKAKATKTKESKGKKRSKNDGDAPKKSKKHKPNPKSPLTHLDP